MHTGLSCNHERSDDSAGMPAYSDDSDNTGRRIFPTLAKVHQSGNSNANPKDKGSHQCQVGTGASGLRHKGRNSHTHYLDTFLWALPSPYMLKHILFLTIPNFLQKLFESAYNRADVLIYGSSTSLD